VEIEGKAISAPFYSERVRAEGSAAGGSAAGRWHTPRFVSFWGQSPNSPSLRLTRRVRRLAP